MASKTGKKSKVPSTRIGRFTRLGLAAGELALGGVAEGVKNLGRKPQRGAAGLFLTGGNAKKLAARLANMRGAAMKMGQMLSMQGAEFLPTEFADALAILRDSANTMTDSQLRGVMGRELGKGWESKFRHFDYEPIAAASIGQVHRATCKDGRELALKIQYPGVAKSIGSDVDNLAMLIRMSGMLPKNLDISGFIEDAKRQLRREADYVEEARSLKKYRALVGDDDHFVVPRVCDRFSSRRVLAMDYIEGVPLESLAAGGVPQRVRDQIAQDIQRLQFRELFEFRTMQSDPNFANYLYQPDEGKVVLLDFGSTVDFEQSFSEDYAGIASALIARDHVALRHYAERLGYLSRGGSDNYAEQVLHLIDMICEPIYARGQYDFGSSNLFTRMGESGMDLYFNVDKEDYVVPPTEASFLHRKLVGSYLLCARLGARVDVRELIQPYLGVPQLA